MKKKLAMYIFGINSIFFPVIALAQAPQDLIGVIDILLTLFRAFIPLLFVLALVFFLWGAAKYIYQADDATARAEGSKTMLYGVIALFVMVSIWGLVGLLGGTFGIDTVIPSFGGGSGSGPPPFSGCFDDGGVPHCYTGCFDDAGVANC